MELTTKQEQAMHPFILEFIDIFNNSDEATRTLLLKSKASDIVAAYNQAAQGS